MNIPRFYFHYELWEEYHHRMWTPLVGKDADNMLKQAIIFTGNYQKYGLFMRKVVNKWIVSCAVNLSNKSMNRRAWIGHAACCLAISSPESITRLAWHYLSQEQQDLANNEADKAIELWESQFEKGYQICLNLV